MSLRLPDPRFSLRPVGEDPDANARWVDRDLASMMEGFYGERLSPPLDQDARDRLAARLPPGWEVPPLSPEDGFGERFWIVEHQTIVGTILLAPPWPRERLLGVFGLYVDPDARGRGAAEAALHLAEQAALAQGLQGLHLDALWTWGKALRFYLDRGFWLRSWKRAMHLMHGPVYPRRALRWDGDRVSLWVESDGGPVELIRAERRGDLLGWEPMTEAIERHMGPRLFALQVEATFALILANRGWPLATSPRSWAKLDWPGDLGGPDALGLKIMEIESYADEDGVRIDAPRIPGLPDRIRGTPGAPP